MHDSFFTRSVIYLAINNNEGTLGFILNFKSQFLLRDFKPQLKNGNIPIYEGGPVAKSELFFLHQLGHKISDSLQVSENCFFGGNYTELLDLIETGEANEQNIRMFIGYSGWDSAQLNDEITKNSWLTLNENNFNCFSNDYYSMWKQALSNYKKSYSIFSDIGNNVSMN